MAYGYGVSPSRTAPNALEVLTPLCDCVSDEDLARLLARDLNAGFETLARAWQHRLYAFALRMTGSAGDAEDLAQETLVRAWRALSDYPAERRRALQVRPWLFQIAVNLARNAARDAHRSPTISLDDEATDDATRSAHESPAERLEDDDPSAAPEESLERRQRLETLARLLLSLPPAQRLALVLRHVEGMSYGEMAAITSLPVGTLKSHASRGAADLRRAIERERAREEYREKLELGS
jgi:RNA polymerase sigma-70 factor, ECF subfamily